MITAADDPADPRLILILKPSSLGDIVHTLPAVACLKQRWPAAEIVWMTNPEWAPLLEQNPVVDRVWIFPRRSFRGAGTPFQFLKWVRSRPFGRPDLALDFQGLLRSAITGRLTQPHVYLGLSDAREGARFFYQRVAQVDREHSVLRYLKLAALADVPVDPGAPQFPLPEGTRPEAPELPETFALLHPFSRGENKSLSPDAVSQLCEMLSPHPVVIAGRAEQSLTLPSNAIDFLNRTTLPQLIWLLRKASYVISVDSGPMHLAAAVTSRLIGIHSWSDPVRVGPYRPEAWVWKNGQLTQMRRYEETGGGPAKLLPDREDLALLAAHVHRAIGT